MGKYLALLDALEAKSSSDKSAKSDISLPFGRFGRFGRIYSLLEARCPDHVPADRWQQAVENGGVSKRKPWAGRRRTCLGCTRHRSGRTRPTGGCHDMTRLA